MASFAKIYSSIFTGSLRGHSDEILVFVNILTHTSHDGKADIHPNTIIDETGLPASRVHKAIGVLSSPDPESRTPASDGRRIVLLDEHRKWGWRVVNHDFYRNLSGDASYREKTRKRVKRFRDLQALTDDRYVTEALCNGGNIASVSVSVPSSFSTEGGTGETTPDPKTILKMFEEFWNLYPNKARIIEAQRAWVEVRAYTCFQEIVKAVKEQISSEAWNRDGGRYIPHPSSWLRDKRWCDSVAPRTNGNGKDQEQSMPPWIREKKLQEIVDSHPANPNSAYHKPNCTEEQKIHYKQAKESLKAVKKLLQDTAIHGH